MREIAERYNASLDVDDFNDIDLDKCNDAFELIGTLWVYGLKTPPGMGLDDRYDDTFADYVYENWAMYMGEIYYPDNHKKNLALLLRYPKELAFFIHSSLDPLVVKKAYILLNGTGEHSEPCEDAFVKIWKQLRVNLGHNLAQCLYNLSPYDLAFLAISFERSELFCPGRNLEHTFYDYVKQLQ